jgi:hypothetical protein
MKPHRPDPIRITQQPGLEQPHFEGDEPVAYRVCTVDENGQGRPLPDDPRFHAALDEMARAAVRLAKADRERQFQERLAAWLADQQATIAAALEALPAGMAPQTQAANVHAALLAEAGLPDAQVTTEWAARLPAVDEVVIVTEQRARRIVEIGRDAVGYAEEGAELVSRIVVTGGWQRVDGAL